MKVKVVKREERERRIRPVVTKKLLLDEKSRLVRRVHQIDEQLRTIRTVEA